MVGQRGMAALLAVRELKIRRGYDEIAQAERSGERTYDNLTNGDGLEVDGILRIHLGL